VSENPSTTEKLNFKTNPSDRHLYEYYQLQQDLVSISLILIGMVFVYVWLIYSLNVALNYLIGACTGVVYLRMLGKDVARLSPERMKLSKARFALFIGLIILAARWDQLQIMPIFLGFLTYKAAVVVYMLRSI
jgi:ATP synthase protein I